MEKDTERTLFIGRREDGSIYGTWTVRQWEGQEELADDDPQVVAFVNRPPRKLGDPKPTSKIIDPRLEEKESP